MSSRNRAAGLAAALGAVLVLSNAASAGAARVGAPVPVHLTPEGTTGTPLYWIDFDIGTTVVRAGATHQSTNPDSIPYVVLPDVGFPLTIVNFTVPPNYADLGEFYARLVYSASMAPCFFVLQVDSVGYGPGHSAALFDHLWPGSPTPADEGIVSVPVAFNSHEIVITLRPLPSFPALPGDAMALTLRRDAADVNDTCATNALLRSISLTYEGVLIFADGFGTGDTSAWS